MAALAKLRELAYGRSGIVQRSEGGTCPNQRSALSARSRGRPASAFRRGTGILLRLACLWLVFCRPLPPVTNERSTRTQHQPKHPSLRCIKSNGGLIGEHIAPSVPVAHRTPSKCAGICHGAQAADLLRGPGRPDVLVVVPPPGTTSAGRWWLQRLGRHDTRYLLGDGVPTAGRMPLWRSRHVTLSNRGG